MNALWVLLIAVAAYGVGYWVYAKTIDRRIIQPDEKRATPAKMYMDGVDFIPANRNVLFGYQLSPSPPWAPSWGRSSPSSGAHFSLGAEYRLAAK